jgi:GTP pyrophosphokinase
VVAHPPLWLFRGVAPSRYAPPVLTARFEQALVYASRLHATQLRKGSATPYVAHLLAVAALVLEHGADEDQTIAALLHDAVEDQGGQKTLAAIRRRFGPVVAGLVLACSDTDVTPKPPWRPRKEAYLEHLRTAPAAVRLISAADKVHNARSTVADLRAQGPRVWKRFHAGPDEQLWYYRSLVAIFRRRGPKRLAQELARVVAEMEALVTRPVVKRPAPRTRPSRSAPAPARARPARAATPRSTRRGTPAARRR